MDEDELKAVVEARKELGPGHDEELIAGFLDKMDKEIDRRVDERLATRRKPRGKSHLAEELGIFIPIFIIGGIFGGPAGIFTVAALFLIVFVVTSLRR